MDPTFLIVCAAIVTITSAITGIVTVIQLMKKPVKDFEAKQEAKLTETIVKILESKLPELLKKHDEETRERYKNDRDKYLKEIKNEVSSDIQDELQQVKILGIQYEALVISAKDVLREKIIKIYTSNKDNKSMSLLEKERLDQFYKDYKALKGNSYIDKYYRRMTAWKIHDYDDDDDSEII